jgi:hypothetical protein
MSSHREEDFLHLIGLLTNDPGFRNQVMGEVSGYSMEQLHAEFSKRLGHELTQEQAEELYRQLEEWNKTQGIS